ncbi:MAG TPA: hypothetical protein VHI72_02810, partial [Hyphomicrobiaceae bacterium]|nr:hypothetical protein [Hyphomicrobiaceae bacterium]
SIGCEYGQGPYYGEAMSEREALQLIKVARKVERRMKKSALFRRRHRPAEPIPLEEPMAAKPAQMPIGSAPPNGAMPGPAKAAATPKPPPGKVAAPVARHGQGPARLPPPLPGGRPAMLMPPPPMAAARGPDRGGGKPPAAALPAPAAKPSQGHGPPLPARSPAAPSGPPLAAPAAGRGQSPAKPPPPPPPPGPVSQDPRAGSQSPLPPRSGTTALPLQPPPPLPRPAAPLPTAPPRGNGRPSADFSTLPPAIAESLARLAGRQAPAPVARDAAETDGTGSANKPPQA